MNSNPERPWATGVLVLAGAISLSFNVVHSLHTDLAPPLAVLYGGGPVVLAAMQSHVVALQAARGDLVGGWRKLRTFSLVVGALALSFLGIYDILRQQVPDPIGRTPINEPAVILPIVVDLLALSALSELLRPGRTKAAADRTETDRTAEPRTVRTVRADRTAQGGADEPAGRTTVRTTDGPDRDDWTALAGTGPDRADRTDEGPDRTAQATDRTGGDERTENRTDGPADRPAVRTDRADRAAVLDRMGLDQQTADAVRRILDRGDGISRARLREEGVTGSQAQVGALAKRLREELGAAGLRAA